MSQTDTQLVWANTVDQGAWRVEVRRLEKEPHKGMLTVWDMQTQEHPVIVHGEVVGLAYEALFGPDIGDVASWEQRVLEVIDNPDLRKDPHA